MGAWSYRRLSEQVLGTKTQNFRLQWQLDNSEELSRLSRIKAEAFAKRNKDAVALAHLKTVCKQHRVGSEWFRF